MLSASLRQSQDGQAARRERVDPAAKPTPPHQFFCAKNGVSSREVRRGGLIVAGLLRLQAEAGLALLLRRNPDVGDRGFHGRAVLVGAAAAGVMPTGVTAGEKINGAGVGGVWAYVKL
jgi:hypothetical protein